MSNDVLLVHPGPIGSINPVIPWALPCLGGYLQKHGYKVQLLDTRVDPPEIADLSHTLSVGLSVQTGPWIAEALDFAKRVRDKDPDIPIIWGGTHPSALPEETAAHELVDVVVKDEGEATMLELVKKIETGEPWQDIPGIVYRRKDGQIVRNPNRSFIDMNEIPIELPYDLLSLDKYPHVRQGHMSIYTTRGCPYQCSFCYNLYFNRLRYRKKDPDRVAQELELLKDKYHMKSADFFDDEFFIVENHVEGVCKAFSARGIDIPWETLCRLDRFNTFDKELLDLVQKSGCFRISFGTESGSQRILDMLTKSLKVEVTLAAAKKLAKTQLEACFLMMCGVPTETMDDLKLSFDLLDELLKINPESNFVYSIYTPYPGTPLYEMSLEHGLEPPGSLEAWSTFTPYIGFKAPWITQKYYDFLRSLMVLTRFAHWDVPPGMKRFPYNLVYEVLKRLEGLRWRFKFFEMPGELRFLEKRLIEEYWV